MIIGIIGWPPPGDYHRAFSLAGQCGHVGLGPQRLEPVKKYGRLCTLPAGIDGESHDECITVQKALVQTGHVILDRAIRLKRLRFTAHAADAGRDGEVGHVELFNRASGFAAAFQQGVHDAVGITLLAGTCHERQHLLNRPVYGNRWEPPPLHFRQGARPVNLLLRGNHGGKTLRILEAHHQRIKGLGKSFSQRIDEHVPGYPGDPFFKRLVFEASHQPDPVGLPGRIRKYRHELLHRFTRIIGKKEIVHDSSRIKTSVHRCF